MTTPFIPRPLLLTLPAAKRSATSALIMLDSNLAMAIDNKKTKKNKSKAKSSETIESVNVKSRKILLRSIAAFLEINGFDKTLSVLRSEAQIEMDGLRETSIDIEELLCKFLESSQGHDETAIDWQKETDSQKSDASKKHEIEQHHNDSHKKKRKHRIEADDDTNTAVEENGLDNKSNEVNGLKKLKSAKEDLSIEIKDKKKKRKPQSISPEENADKNILEVSCGMVENGDHDSILPNIDVNGKTKKKKKHKTSNEDHTKIQEIVEEKVAEQNAKHKGEKKRKRKGEECTKQDPSAKSDLDKDENEDGTCSKSKKRRIQSAEAKTVNAFQRVKIDEVKFADEKLQDNSYWAHDSTGSGYGAKAQEVLGQVRGRGFRHEKTKKKRGSYRGGQIDLQSHSIKFNYSEEE